MVNVEDIVSLDIDSMNAEKLYYHPDDNTLVIYKEIGNVYSLLDESNNVRLFDKKNESLLGFAMYPEHMGYIYIGDI